MATQVEIFNVRLRVSDPAGFISLVEASNLPATPASQTAYLYNGAYYATEKTSGATISDYDIQELRLADSVIGGYIDDKGVHGAICSAIKQLIANLWMEMRIKSLSGCVDNKREESGYNTGRMFTTKSVEIAGGNL